MAKRVTVIDIGSNSVRMVVYEKSSRYAFHLLHEERSKVRISQNAYKFNGNLQKEPMQRAFNALASFLTISKSFKSRKLLCVATSALRDAPNKKEFIQRVKEQLKINVKIISGEKEAYFGGIACANLLPQQQDALTVDIGGGSTELATIDNKDVRDTFSLNIGTVRLKELFCDAKDRVGAIEYIDERLDTLALKGTNTLIGIGGTFRAIATAIRSQDTYPLSKIHAYEFSVERLSNFIDSILRATSQEELIALGIKENRFDVIQPGALILQRVLQKLNIKKIITSGVGVREGVYLSDLLRNSKHKFPHNFNTSVKHLLDAHVDEGAFSSQLNTLVKRLFDLTQKHTSLNREYRYELALAAKLYPAGSSLHFFSQNKHSYYLIQNALEYGFTHKSITLISTLAKYAKSKLPSDSHLLKYQELLPSKQTTENLSYLLSLAIVLLAHRPRDIDFDLSFREGVLEVISMNNLYLAKESMKKLARPAEAFQVRFK